MIIVGVPLYICASASTPIAAALVAKGFSPGAALLGNAYRRAPAFYRFVRALDSYDLIIDKNTTLMLPADNELFRYLDSRTVPR